MREAYLDSVEHFGLLLVGFKSRLFRNVIKYWNRALCKVPKINQIVSLFPLGKRNFGRPKIYGSLKDHLRTLRRSMAAQKILGRPLAANFFFLNGKKKNLSKWVDFGQLGFLSSDFYKYSIRSVCNEIFTLI